MSDQPPRQRDPLAFRLSVEGMPELMARHRLELARLLRTAADDEPPAVAARLREIAAIFETGLSEDL